jgi:hypothetical protein
MTMTAALRGAHLVLVEPEVMRQLVPHGILHDFGNLILALRGIFYLPLEKRDLVRHPAMIVASVKRRDTLIEAEKEFVVAYAERGELLSRGLILDDHRHILKFAEESLGNGIDSLCYQRFEFLPCNTHVTES